MPAGFATALGASSPSRSFHSKVMTAVPGTRSAIFRERDAAMEARISGKLSLPDYYDAMDALADRLMVLAKDPASA